MTCAFWKVKRMVEAEVGENRSSTFAPRILGKKRLNSGKSGRPCPAAKQLANRPQPTSNTTSMQGSVVRNTREKLK